MGSHFRKTKHNHASVLDRRGDYQGTCRGKASKAGFNSSLEKRSEVHHIVCEHSMEQRFDFYPDDKAVVSYIEGCLWITPWDINNADNLIGLQRNRRSRVDWAGTSDQTQWTPVDLPSHQVDHNTTDGYTNEVGKYLKSAIWDNLEELKDEPHEVGASAILTELENASKYFLEVLETRGLRPPGKVVGWANRYPDEPGYVSTWYYPFSMGAAPIPRQPGARGKEATGALTQLKTKLA